MIDLILGLLRRLLLFSIMIAVTASGYLTYRHLERARDRGQEVIVYPLLRRDAPQVTQRGVRFVAWPLWLCRFVAIWSLFGLSTAHTWSPPPPEGTLVLAQGQVSIDEQWPRPIYVVSPIYPFKSLSHSSSAEGVVNAQRQKVIEGQWTLTSPQPLVLSDEVTTVLSVERTGVKDIDGATLWAGGRSTFRRVVTPRPLRAISGARARWEEVRERGARGSERRHRGLDLSVEVTLSLYERGQSIGARPPLRVSLEQYQAQRRQWIELGSLVRSADTTPAPTHSKDKEKVAQLWAGRFPFSKIQSHVLRVSVTRGSELISEPYPLCIPQAQLVESSLDHQLRDPLELQALRSLFSLRSSPKLLAPIKRDLTLGTFTSASLFTQVELHQEEPVSSESSAPVYLVGDLWSQLSDQQRYRRGFIDPHKRGSIRDEVSGAPLRVWTPQRAPTDSMSPLAISIQITPPSERQSGSVHLLASPPWPSPPVFVDRSATLTSGRPLLWGAARRIGDTLGAQGHTPELEASPLWFTSQAILTEQTSPDHPRRYVFGFSPHKLQQSAPLWSRAFMSALRDEILSSTSRCLEWRAGEVTPIELGVDQYGRDTLAQLKASALSGISLLTGQEWALDESLLDVPSTSSSPYASMKLPESGLFKLSVRSDRSDPDESASQPLWVIRRPLESAAVSLIDDAHKDASHETRASPERRDLTRTDERSPPLTLSSRLDGLQAYPQRSYVGLIILALALFSLWWIRRPPRSLNLLVGISVVITLGAQWWVNARHPLEVRLLNDGGRRSTQPMSAAPMPSTPASTLGVNPALAEHARALNVRLTSSDVSDQHALSLLRPSASLTPKQVTSAVISGSILISAEIDRPKRRVHLELSEHRVTRDATNQYVHLSALISTSRHANATLYLGDRRHPIKLAPPATLIGGWVSAPPNLSAIRLKVEVDDPSDRSSGLNQLIPIPPPQRSYAWAWGAGASELLTSIGVKLAPPPQDALRTSPEESLGLIALHNVTPSSLNETQIRSLLHWVRQGGKLLWMGHLSSAQRDLERSAWDQEAWAQMVPLTLEPPIDPLRQSQVALLIDRSGSTAREAGGPGLTEITSSLSRLVQRLAPRDEVTLISFGGGVSLTSPPTERRALQALPVPVESRGGTQIRSALELALTYRRPSLPAHWVIITDGVWGDEPKELEDLQDRIKASESQVTIVITPHRSWDARHDAASPRCEGACESLRRALGARVIPWSDLNLNALRSPLTTRDISAMHVESGPQWSRRVGGALPPVSKLTLMGTARGVTPLAEVNGYPLLATRRVGRGEVIQLMTDQWELSAAQWARLLRVRDGGQHLWSTVSRVNWSSRGEATLEVSALGAEGLLSEPARLYGERRAESLRWLPVRSGESRLGRCQDGRCEPVGLPLNLSELMMLTSDKTLAPVRLSVTPPAQPLYPMSSQGQALIHTLQDELQRQSQSRSSAVGQTSLDAQLQRRPRLLATEGELLDAITQWATVTRELSPRSILNTLLIALATYLLLELTLWKSRREET